MIVNQRNSTPLTAAIIIIALAGAYNYLQESQIRDFETMTELRTFLENDYTDRIPWTTGFDCEEFTDTLIENARLQGYRLRSIIVDDPNSLWPNNNFYWVGEGSHAVCIAFVAADGCEYYIEPQNDRVLGRVS